MPTVLSLHKKLTTQDVTCMPLLKKIYLIKYSNYKANGKTPMSDEAYCFVIVVLSICSRRKLKHDNCS